MLCFSSFFFSRFTIPSVKESCLELALIHISVHMCVWVCVCCHEASRVLCWLNMPRSHQNITKFFSPYRGASKRNESENGSVERRGSQQHMVHLLLSFRTTKIKTSNNKTRNFMSLFSSSSSPSPSWSFFLTIRLTCVWALVCLFITRRRNNLFGVLSPCVVCDCFFLLVRLRILERMFWMKVSTTRISLSSTQLSHFIKPRRSTTLKAGLKLTILGGSFIWLKLVHQRPLRTIN